MQLIIKATGRCSFDCTFCSANGLDIAHPTNGVPEQIKDLILKLKPNSIIVTGGDPLTVDPSYYMELSEIAKCHISFTSNMKDFYYHPDKWKDILTSDMFGVITSFNYGDTRRWDKDTPYTEEMFRKVHALFKEVTGRTLDFIAVIDESNEHLAMDHVYLAKELGCRVKLNGVFKLGRQDTFYPRYKILQKYVKIIDMGLEDYEITCAERRYGRCGLDTNLLCETTIRACYIDSKGILHYNACEELLALEKDKPMETEFPIEAKPIIPKNHINENCMACELFRLCHGCRYYRAYIDELPEHCEEMLKLKNDLIRQGWAL